MSIEYLKAPSSNHAFSQGIVVKRAPVLYGPTSTSEVNSVRLPGRDDLAAMKLAYREKFFSDEELGTVTLQALNLIFWCSLALAIGAVVIGPLVPWSFASSIVGGVSFFLALNAIVRRNASVKTILFYLIAPIVGLVVLKFIGFVTMYRLFATLVFGGVTLVLFQMHGSKPFAFYHEWLYTNPRLKPETRSNPKRITLAPNMPLLGVIIAIAALVPVVSTTIAIAAVVAVCLVVLGADLNPLAYIAKLKLVFGQYLTYGMASTNAPGVWMPAESWRLRRLAMWRLCGFSFLTLAVGLSLFAPWDVLRWSIKADYGEDVLASAFATPFGWVAPVLQGMYDTHPVYLWVFPVALGLAVLVPFLVLAAVFKRPLTAAYQLALEIEGEKGREPTIDFDQARPEWECYVDRVRTSDQHCKGPLGEDIREAEHLFLGVEPNAQFPILLDKKVLSEHCYIVGDTGSGKTAVGITSLLMQLIRGHRNSDGSTTLPPPMVVLDLKGDPALFHTLREESDKRRRELGITDPDDPTCAFRFFTPEKGRASYFFNPFQSMDSEARSEVQLCHLFLDSLGLNHGEGYGRSYYSRKSRMMLYDALTKGGSKPRSIEELYKRLIELSKDKDSWMKDDDLQGTFNYKHDTFELLATIHTLARYEMLATAGNLANPSRAISMPEVIERRQVAYFWLPAALESISVREIAKLAIFSLLTAAIDRQGEKGGEEGEPRQVYLVMDEFQRIAGENFKVILEQARSFGVSAILANQTQSDLKTHDIDLRPTIRGNTRVKMFFSVTEPEEEKSLSEASGQEIAMLASGMGSLDGAGGPLQWTQSLKPRLTRNDIMGVSDHPLECVLKVSRGAGYTQFAGLPIPARMTYPLTSELYTQRKRMPWPELGEAMVVPTKSPDEHEGDRKREAGDLAFGRLENLFERLKA